MLKNKLLKYPIKPITLTILLVLFLYTYYLGIKWLLIILAPLLGSIIFFTIYPYFVNYVFASKLEGQFLDFLSISLTLEANGLRLDNVFDEAVKGNLKLPSSYEKLAKIHHAISNTIPDPYTSIRKLAEIVPSKRVQKFLRGYSEVLITTNDTLSYVESMLKEEINGLETRITNTLATIDSLFEGLLITLLSILVFGMIPVLSIPWPILFIVIVGLGTTSYLLACKLTSHALWFEDDILLLLSFITILLIPVLLVTGIITPIVATVIVSFFTVLAMLLNKPYSELESSTLVLVEDLYTEARQGVPIDYALLRMGDNWGEPVKSIKNLLLQGVKPVRIVNTLRLPPLPSKILGLILGPIEFSRSHEKHLGYTLRIVDSIRSLRRKLFERGRMYYVYVLTLPIISMVFAKTILSINMPQIPKPDVDLVNTLTSITVLQATITASKVTRGVSLGSLWIPLILVLTIIIEHL